MWATIRGDYMLYFDFVNPYLFFMSLVLLFCAAIYMIFTKKEFIIRHKKTIFIIAIVLLSYTQLVRYVIVVIRDGFILPKHLPFYVCRLSVVVLLYYVITRDKRVESFLFYWGATGLAGIIYPNGDIANIANLTETFYIDHFLLGLTPYFLLVYQGYRPSKENLFKISGFMLFLLLLFIPINNMLETINTFEDPVDYFYLKDMSIFGVLFPNLPTSIFGITFKDLPSILFAFVHAFAAFLFFSVYYFSFRNKEYLQLSTDN